MRRLFAMAFAVALMAPAAWAACPSASILDGILKTNVDKNGYVDYDAIRVNKGGDLYEFTSVMETADLKKCSEAEQLAFWINAYNAHALRLMLARPKLVKASDDFKLFGEKFKVARVHLSLNDIQHRVIRASTKRGGPIEGYSLKKFEPRHHFALVCGTLGSPELKNRAYTAANVEAMLQADAAGFANNPKYLRVEDGKLIVSSIFRWYAEDFAGLGGAGTYLSSLIDPKMRPDAADVLEKLKTDYPDNAKFQYDWTLNSVKNKPAEAPKP